MNVTRYCYKTNNCLIYIMLNQTPYCFSWITDSDSEEEKAISKPPTFSMCK